MLDRIECMFLSNLPPAPTPKVQMQVDILHQVALHPAAFRLVGFYMPADFRLHAKYALLNRFYDDSSIGSVESINAVDFTAELLDAIHAGNWLTAMKHYIEPDILVVDDLELICSKESTQESFYVSVLKPRLEAKKLTIMFSEYPYEELAICMRDDLRNLLRLGFHEDDI